MIFFVITIFAVIILNKQAFSLNFEYWAYDNTFNFVVNFTFSELLKICLSVNKNNHT